MKIRIRVPSGSRRTVEVESEEEKVPYGGVITGADAESTNTIIREGDKVAFERSRKAAEDKLGVVDDGGSTTPGSPAPSTGSYFPPQRATSNTNLVNGSANASGRTPSKSTPANRSLRDRLLQQSFVTISTPNGGDSTPGTPGPSTPFHLPNLSGAQKIRMVRFGTYEIDTWFSAPYPEEYQHVPDGRLWICEFCFKYMKSGFVAERHRVGRKSMFNHLPVLSDTGASLRISC